MKKIIPSIICTILLLSIVSCKSKEPDNHGSVNVRPLNIELKYGEQETIIPSYSEHGSAKQKQFDWKVNKPDIVKCDIGTGNVAIVTATRIGEAKVTFYAKDGSISASSHVSVTSRTNFLSNIFFQEGVSMQFIKNRAQGTLNNNQTTDNMLVYDMDGDKIIQEIYYFNNDKLYSTLIILATNDDNKVEAEQFIEERFKYLTVSGDIKYYDASVFEGYDNNVIVGIFLPDGESGPEGIKRKLGVKYTSRNTLK